MYFDVDGKRFETAQEAAEYIADNLGEEVFDEMLDECHEEVEICGYSYAPSVALYRVDPIAYRCAMADYYDSLSSDIAYELEGMDIGDTADQYGFEVEAVSEYEEVAHKLVRDSDGMMTDYTMYRAKNERGEDFFVCIFGDKDIYSPDEDEPDFESESREEAFEWFDSYNGFDEDE